MPYDTLILQTHRRFPRLADEGVAVQPLEKGGSGRKFFRVRQAGGASMIVVSYTPQRPENLRYVEIAQFLDASSVPVPHIFFHDPEEGLIWMKDLGDVDLWSFRDEPWEVREHWYQEALDAVLLMHTEATAALARQSIPLELEFDEHLYRWEQGYFIENCLGEFFRVPTRDAERLAKAPGLQKLAITLAAEPRVLVHRDFQSQNVLIDADSAWLIDFQGMRPGLAQYDLASLLYDPYVELQDVERDALLAHYKARAAERGMDVGGVFDELYWMCAAQRLMQALGAYGFLGLKCGRPDFLRHIPAARRSLQAVAAQLDDLEELSRLLENLP